MRRKAEKLDNSKLAPSLRQTTAAAPVGESLGLIRFLIEAPVVILAALGSAKAFNQHINHDCNL